MPLKGLQSNSHIYSSFNHDLSKYPDTSEVSSNYYNHYFGEKINVTLIRRFYYCLNMLKESVHLNLIPKINFI